MSLVSELAPSGKLRVGVHHGVPRDPGHLPGARRLADPHAGRCRSPGRARRGVGEERLRPVPQPHAEACAAGAYERDRRFVRAVRLAEAGGAGRAEAAADPGRRKVAGRAHSRRARHRGSAGDRHAARAAGRREVPARVRRGSEGVGLRRPRHREAQRARRGSRSAGGRPVAPMKRLALPVLALLAACVTADGERPEVAQDLAPTGRLRAAINLGNPVLAQKDPASDELRGVSVDLARELGRRLAVPAELIAYDAAGKVTDAVKTGAWDIAFVAIDPARATEIAFTPPYVVIEGTYLVAADSPLRTIADVDREGVRSWCARPARPRRSSCS